MLVDTPGNTDTVLFRIDVGGARSFAQVPYRIPDKIAYGSQRGDLYVGGAGNTSIHLPLQPLPGTS